jgi:hypothetical protein
MREVALWNPEKRRELFQESANKMRVHPAIVEKDFWACLVLGVLFGESRFSKSMIFKGGTSLSKVFGAVERFSEDIDLVLDWRLLGYSNDDPWLKRSNSRAILFTKECEARTADFFHERFTPEFGEELESVLGIRLPMKADKSNIEVAYPHSFELGYIAPTLLLEIGPLAAWTPWGDFSIRPYAAKHMPEYFKIADVRVRSVTAERTFWEKATILHREANRPGEKPMPARYSRHYYDIVMLSRTAIKANALADPSLLDEVIRFKDQFYRCAWARLPDAGKGNIKLLPKAEHRAGLLKDYKSMEEMIFGEKPRLDEILTSLSSLEKEINGLFRG